MGSANRNDFTPYANTSLQALIQHVRLSAHAVLMLRPVFTPVIVPSVYYRTKLTLTTIYYTNALYRIHTLCTFLEKADQAGTKWNGSVCAKTLAESLFLLPSIGVSSQFTECTMRLSSFFNSFMKKNLTQQLGSLSATIFLPSSYKTENYCIRIQFVSAFCYTPNLSAQGSEVQS